MRSDKPVEGLFACFRLCASEIHSCRAKITVMIRHWLRLFC